MPARQSKIENDSVEALAGLEFLPVEFNTFQALSA